MPWQSEQGGGLAFFAVYFVVTSVYLVPMILVGHFARYEQIRWIAQLSSILAGGVFLWMGLTLLLASR